MKTYLHAVDYFAQRIQCSLALGVEAHAIDRRQLSLVADDDHVSR